MTDQEGSGLHDKALATVKAMAGAIVGSDGLKEQARLHREHAEAVSQSEEAEALAARRAEEAAIVSRQQELRAESERLTAEELREGEDDQVERFRIEGVVEIDAEATQKQFRTAVRHTEEQEALEDVLAAAERHRREGEIAAVEAERQANAARMVARSLDDPVTDRMEAGS